MAGNETGWYWMITGFDLWTISQRETNGNDMDMDHHPQGALHFQLVFRMWRANFCTFGAQLCERTWDGQLVVLTSIPSHPGQGEIFFMAPMKLKLWVLCDIGFDDENPWEPRRSWRSSPVMGHGSRSITTWCQKVPKSLVGYGIFGSEMRCTVHPVRQSDSPELKQIDDEAADSHHWSSLVPALLFSWSILLLSSMFIIIFYHLQVPCFMWIECSRTAQRSTLLRP